MVVMNSLIFNDKTMAAKKNTSENKSTGKTKKSQTKNNELAFDAPVEPKEEVVLTTKPIEQTEKKGDEYSSPSFSFDKPIYLQINRQNLFQYFITGLISPTRYEKNRPQPDIQSTIKECLQLSNGLLDELKSTDAIVELSFSPLEKNELNIFSSIALLSKPIPVSRIKRIYVKTAKDKDDVLATARTSDAGIIPDALVADSFPEAELIIQEEQVKNEQIKTDFNSKINRFDHVLGSYAFVKNVSLLFTNKSNTYSNIPDHYLGFVKLLLNEQSIPADTSNRQYNFYKQLLGIKFHDENPVLKWLFERASDETNFTSADLKEFGNVLLKNHSDSDFKEEGKEALVLLNDGIKRKTAPKFISEIKHIDKIYLYIFSFLYLYGNKSAEDRTNSRIGLPNEASPNYAEFVFALLGYFYGYTLLRNRDEKQTYTDAFIDKFSNNFDRPTIKFDLTTLFDYYLIEAIYQFVFNEKISTQKFDYIKPSLEAQEQISLSNVPSDYEFSISEIFYKQFFKLKKKSKSDELIKKLIALPDAIPVVSEIGLYCLRNGIKFKWNLNAVLSAFTDIKKLKAIATISKSDIAEHIQSGKCNFEELSLRIETTIKFKEHE
jgi:hypothetical protein